MAMPGGQGQMGGMSQQQMMHQQMVAQQQAQAAAQAAAAQAAQQQQMGHQGQGMSPMMGVPTSGPSPHPQGPPMMGPGGHPPQQMQPGQHPGQGPPHGQMGPGQQQGHPGHPGQPQQQQPQGGQLQGGMDNISKAKSLVNPIKDSLSNVLRTAANAIYANNMVDSGSKPVDYDVSRFDRTLEEFFTLCDQMEVHLKTSIECINQGMSSQRYLQTPVVPNRMEGSLTYPQYINVVKGQIAYAKDIHSTLAEAAQKLSSE